ncbi:MAG: histidine kinase dimerization/phospho-acceptor domain-containing protein [Myxococcota bacterium]
MIAAFLAIELAALLATGMTTSALLPLSALPPLLAALTRAGEREVTVLVRGTLVVLVVTAVIDGLGPARALPALPFGAVVLVAAIVGYLGALALRRRLAEAEARARAANQRAIEAVAEHHALQLSTAATFAHELKNPLAAMQGLATLIRRRQTKEPELADELAGLVEDVHAMATAVSELLDFSRAVHPDSLRRVNVAELVAAVCRARQVTPSALAVPPDLAVVVEPRKAERVLQALLQLGHLGALTVSAREDARSVIIDVSIDVDVGDARESLAVASALAEQQGGGLTVRPAPFAATLTWPRIEARA